MHFCFVIAFLLTNHSSAFIIQTGFQGTRSEIQNIDRKFEAESVVRKEEIGALRDEQKAEIGALRYEQNKKQIEMEERFEDYMKAQTARLEAQMEEKMNSYWSFFIFYALMGLWTWYVVMI